MGISWLLVSIMHRSPVCIYQYLLSQVYFLGNILRRGPLLVFPRVCQLVLRAARKACKWTLGQMKTDCCVSADVNWLKGGYWRVCGPWIQTSFGWAAVCGSGGSRGCNWSSPNSNHCSSPASGRERLRGSFGRAWDSSALQDCRRREDN